jgi:hypothetical protein
MDQKKRKLEDGGVPTGGPALPLPAFEVTKEDVKRLVEPFTKEQLMDLLENAALVHSGLSLFQSSHAPESWQRQCVYVRKS